MNRLIVAISIWSLVILLLPKVTLAILPPDLIVSIGSQFIQLIAIIGFFSAALLSTILLFYRQFLQIVYRFRYSILIILPAILLTIGAHFAINKIQTQSNNTLQIIKAADEKINRLQQVVSNSYSLKQLQDYVSNCDQATGTIAISLQSSCTPGHLFLSDTITVFGQTPTGQIVIEIDANRLEKVAGVFSQYFFLNAFIDGVDHTDYVNIIATTSKIQTSGFLKEFTKVSAKDQSTRAAFSITVEIARKTYTIEIPEVTGDFITRDTPDYTRIQSPAEATITVDAVSYKANALVEAVYSDDYTKKIFFPDRDNQKVTTSQFVLWDSLENFYLFDDTKTDSFAPQYAPHTWLLYKEAENKILKKAFTGSYKQTVAVLGSREWTINFSEFNGAQVSLTELATFKDTGGRSRFLVSGTVVDAQGSRNIDGVVHVID